MVAMDNLTETDDGAAPDFVRGILATLSGLSILVNVLFLIFGFKTLRRTFHNLLILSLCFGQTFTGMSFFWTILSSFNGPLQYEPCLISFFMSSFGISSVYNVLVALCFERLLTVRSFNFGMKEKFEQWKWRIVLGVQLIAFCISTVTLITPSNKDISYCLSRNLYGKYSKFVQGFLACSFTLAVFLIIVTSIITSIYLWKIFFHATNKIGPSNGNIEIKNIGNKTDCFEKGTQYRRKKEALKQTNVVDKTAEKHIVKGFLTKTNASVDSSYYALSNLPGNSSNVENHTHNVSRSGDRTPSNPCNLDQNSDIYHCSIDIDFEPEIEIIEAHCDIEKISDDKCQINAVKVDDNTQHDSTNTKLGATDNSSKAFTATLNKYNTTKRVSEKEQPGQGKAWEIRAFMTSVVFATMILLLTGPYITLACVEVFTDHVVPNSFRLIAFNLILFGNLINPFIYAWRIPEIRQLLRKPC